MRVGVIGPGRMGIGAALRLRRTGHQVFGCDINGEAPAEAAAAGAETGARPDRLPADLQALVVLVADAAQAEEVLFGAAGAIPQLAAGTVVLTSVTMAPEAARVLDHRLSAAGLLALDAPVSGGPPRAREGGP